MSFIRVIKFLRFQIGFYSRLLVKSIRVLVLVYLEITMCLPHSGTDGNTLASLTPFSRVVSANSN